jgi:uncharacterized protein YcaQ
VAIHKPKSNISPADARYLAIKNQLLIKPDKSKTRKSLLKIIEQLGYIQIDTISVVERAHNHILWTRFPAYNKSMLHLLLEKDRKIFEYWFHAASFLPMRDFKYSLYTKEYFRKRYSPWMKKNRKIVNHVMERIKEEGALKSKDFEHNGEKLTGWWDRKPAKAALECLFMIGELMITKREGFQKAYNLTERILPAGIETTVPGEEEMFEHLLLSRINAFGFANEPETKYLRRIHNSAPSAVINRLIEDKIILPVTIGSLKDIYYTTESKLKQLKRKSKAEEVHILSPFDNLIIQRKSLKNIFGFEYVLECYVPAAKRKYGYFNMPVLAGDRFVGTLDAKADRNAKNFIIRSLRLDKVTTPKRKKIHDKIGELAEFTECSAITSDELRITS